MTHFPLPEILEYMDISPKQIQEISEIEKQLDQGSPTGPKILSQQQETNRSLLKNLLAAAGIVIGTTLGIIVLVMVPFGKKTAIQQPQVITGTLTIAQPNITVTTEYVNPFATSAQYSNPFTASQNPFAQFTK